MTFSANTRAHTSSRMPSTGACKPVACQANAQRAAENYIDFGQVESVKDDDDAKSKSKPHAKRIRFFFWEGAFFIRLTLTSSSSYGKKKRKVKTQWQKIHLARFPAILPLPHAASLTTIAGIEGGAENFLNYCQNISAWLQCWPTDVSHTSATLVGSERRFFSPPYSPILFFAWMRLPFCPPHANVATKNAATKRKITLQHFRRMQRDAR